MTAPLDVSALVVRYGAQTVLDTIDLQVPKGGIFGLIGLNGVGKTTLIKTILDLVRPQSGRINLFGADHRRPSSRESLAYLPEKFTPSQRLRGWEFLSLSLSYFGLRLDREEALAMAAEFGFDGKALGRSVGTYSKGMGQKVGLIATFLSNRPLLILDEPMSGLDPQARQQLKGRLEAYRAAGNTVFFSSHILADMDEICDTVAVLHGAKIRFHGTPAEMKQLYAAPLLEKAFMNIIEPA
jgi:ABC-2 type transport system ATP-binding protein